MRQENTDTGDKIVDLYANADSNFDIYKPGLPFNNENRKYDMEIAWVRRTPGFIIEVRY